MTDTLRPPAGPAPAAWSAPDEAPGAPLPGLPGYEPGEPRRRRDVDWGLIIGLTLVSLITAGVVIAFFVSTASASSGAGGCGGG